jgi:hypothetical protein
VRDYFNSSLLVSKWHQLVGSLQKLFVSYKIMLKAKKSMFGKKQPEQPTQSQIMSGVTVNGGVVQQGQAGRDLQQVQSGNLKTSQEITSAEVVKQLQNLEAAVKTSALEQSQQEELLDYLRPAKREAAKEGGNKELVGQSLKEVSETLKMVKDSTEAGKSLWQISQEVFKTIAPWLGVAAKFIGM